MKMTAFATNVVFSYKQNPTSIYLSVVQKKTLRIH